MRLIKLLILLIVVIIAVNAQGTCDNVKNSLSNLRKKRYLNFPPGTAVVMTLSLVKAIMTHIPSGWNVAIEIDVIFPMLTQEMMNALFKRKLHHRQKREFWERLENALGGHNLNGRACLYRSICEARLYLAPKGKSLVHDLLRALFSAPLHEEEFKEEVAETYDELLEPDVCEKMHDCSISLLEVIFALNKNHQ